MTAAIFSDESPSDFAISAVLRAAASGLAAPILVTILMPLAAQSRQHRAHPLLQQRIEAAVRILHARLLRQRNGALAQALEHQILDVALFGEFDRGLDAIARIAGAGSDPDGSHHFSPK